MISKGLTFIVSDKCNITCDFCGPDCGPKHEIYLKSESMLKIFYEMLSLMKIRLVVFTGGEPTLFLDEICKVISEVSKHNIPTRVVTNAYWGKNAYLAEKVVSKLKDAGLKEFNFSVDDFHQKYIPVNDIARAVLASIKFDIPVVLAHKSTPSTKISRLDFERAIGFDIPTLESVAHLDERIPVLFSTARTVPIGRGSENIDRGEWIRFFGDSKSWIGPCNEVFSNVTVQPDGSLSPCCGIIDRKLPEFYYGNVVDMPLVDVITSADQVILYNWLALEGPSGIKDYIESKRPEMKKEFHSTYIQNCELCQDLFSCPSKRKVIEQGTLDKKNEITLKRYVHETSR